MAFPEFLGHLPQAMNLDTRKRLQVILRQYKAVVRSPVRASKEHRKAFWEEMFVCHKRGQMNTKERLAGGETMEIT